MEEFLLKAKPLQIFLSFFAPSMIAAVRPNFHVNVYLIKIVIMVLPYVIWIFMLGRALNMCIAKRYRLYEAFHIAFMVIFILVFVPIAMLLDYSLLFLGLAVVIPALMIISPIYMLYFSSKALTTAETGRRTSFGEHTREFLILATGPIGIWFIQPRINEVWETNKHRFEDDFTDED